MYPGFSKGDLVCALDRGLVCIISMRGRSTFVGRFAFESQFLELRSFFAGCVSARCWGFRKPGSFGGRHIAASFVDAIPFLVRCLHNCAICLLFVIVSGRPLGRRVRGLFTFSYRHTWFWWVRERERVRERGRER